MKRQIYIKQFQRQLISAEKHMRRIEQQLREQGYKPIPGSWDEWIKTEEKSND